MRATTDAVVGAPFVGVAVVGATINNVVANKHNTIKVHERPPPLRVLNPIEAEGAGTILGQIPALPSTSKESFIERVATLVNGSWPALGAEGRRHD